MIRLGCCAFNFGWLDLRDAIQLVSQLGFRYADIGATGPASQVDQMQAAREPKRVGAELRAIASSCGVRLVELFACSMCVDGTPIDNNHPDASVRKRVLAQFRGLCQCAAEAGFQSVMGVPGRYQPTLGAAGSWDVARQMLVDMVAIPREYGVRLNVEPSSNSILNTPDAALRMARQVPGLTYTLDYAHYVGQDIPQSDIDPLHAYAAHLHAKQARPGYLKSFYHLGTIDFGTVLEDLLERGWEGTVSVECIGQRVEQDKERFPAYREVSRERGPEPARPGIINHPVFQTVALAYALEQILDDKQEAFDESI